MMNVSLFWRGVLALMVLVVPLVVVDAWQRTRPEARQRGSPFSLWSPIIGPGDADDLPEAVPAGVPKAAPDYGEAADEFGDRRFQLVNCRGTPGRMTVKRGSVVMLDNRDDETHAVAVGSTRVNIGPYGFSLRRKRGRRSERHLRRRRRRDP